MRVTFKTNSVTVLLALGIAGSFVSPSALSDTRYRRVTQPGQLIPIEVQVQGYAHKPLLRPRLQPTWPESVPEKGYYTRHIVVKFVDPVPVRLTEGSILPPAVITEHVQTLVPLRVRNPRLAYDVSLSRPVDAKSRVSLRLSDEVISRELNTVNSLMTGGALVGIEPLFSRPLHSLASERDLAERLSGEQMADLSNYYHIITRSPADTDGFLGTLRTLKIVEVAYRPPVPALADIPPSTPSVQVRQMYLDPAPNGIDAVFAWTVTGGTGAGIKLADIEINWDLEHEELPSPFSRPDGVLVGETHHGTAVLGVLVSRDDSAGIKGIVSGSDYSVVSIVRLSLPELDPDPYFGTVADAVSVATGQLDSRTGPHVILIEQHMPPLFTVSTECECNCDQEGYIPVEYWQAEFDAISRATALGLIVVEPAGNGGQDLDDAAYRGRFDPGVRDSGAIMVGASSVGGDATVAQPKLVSTHSAACFSNHGQRVNVHSWGEKVFTAGYGLVTVPGAGNDKRQWYTNDFGGTSAASAIVAGAAAAVQGARRESGNTGLGFLDMRRLFITTGTPQVGYKHIGPQPNLRAALQSLATNPPPDYKCYAPADHSPDCGGAACIRKRGDTVCSEECAFLFFLCDVECVTQILDEYECVIR